MSYDYYSAHNMTNRAADDQSTPLPCPNFGWKETYTRINANDSEHI